MGCASVAKAARRPRKRLLLSRSREVGGPAWLVRRPPRREWAAQMLCRFRQGQTVVGCFYVTRRTRAARPRLGRGASWLTYERAGRERARSVADAAPNV